MTPERKRAPRVHKDPLRRVERSRPVIRGSTPCWALQRLWGPWPAGGFTMPMYRTARGTLTKRPEDAETFDTEHDALEYAKKCPASWKAVPLTLAADG